MTITAHFRRHFLVRTAKAVALGVSGTVGLSRVSAFATLQSGSAARNARCAGSFTNFTPRPSTVSETNSMRERRANPVGRAATASVPRISLGGLRLAVLDLEQTADFMIKHGVPATPGQPSAVPDFG